MRPRRGSPVRPSHRFSRISGGSARYSAGRPELASRRGSPAANLEVGRPLSLVPGPARGRAPAAASRAHEDRASRLAPQSGALPRVCLAVTASLRRLDHDAQLVQVADEGPVANLHLELFADMLVYEDVRPCVGPVPAGARPPVHVYGYLDVLVARKPPSRARRPAVRQRIGSPLVHSLLSSARRSCTPCRRHRRPP